jgi:hypothetical protein
VHRPDALHWGWARVSALAHNRDGAVCTWRFAEGFGREHRHRLAQAAGRTREQHVLARCRSFDEPSLVLDCVGGLGRELNWRSGGRVPGAPPATLTAPEQRAYAFEYGTHRFGDVEACRDFRAAELRADCVHAAELDCLVFTDLFTGLATGQRLRRPSCALAEPPMSGYWSAQRQDLLKRTHGTTPNLTRVQGGTDLQACVPVLQRCYSGAIPMP